MDTFRRLLALPNAIGAKDGYSDLRLLSEMQAAVARPFIIGNSMPVTETYAPLYARMNVRSYSPGASLLYRSSPGRMTACSNASTP